MNHGLFCVINGAMLRIPRPLRNQIIEHLKAVYPEEGCGLAAGTNNLVSQIYPVENILHSQTAYEMEPLSQVQTMLIIERQAETLLAIYHSHPHGPPHPSETDIAQAYYPDSVYLIISLANFENPSIRGFQIVDGQATERSIIIE